MTMSDTSNSAAMMSVCLKYRYSLVRLWEDGGNIVNFVMLNPSTADATEDDPTIRRCVGFAKAWGHAGLVVTNLFALRSTDPNALKRSADPIGPDNDAVVLSTAIGSAAVVCAWGVNGSLYGRDKIVSEMLRRSGVATKCLRLTKDGAPCHPLYLPSDLGRSDFHP
jgi:hypothetical protein